MAAEEQCCLQHCLFPGVKAHAVDEVSSAFAKTLPSNIKTLTKVSNIVQNGKYWCSVCKTDKLKRPKYLFEVPGE